MPSIGRVLAVVAIALWLWVAGALAVINACGDQCNGGPYILGWPIRYGTRISNHSVPTLLEFRYGGVRFGHVFNWRCLLTDVATAGLILAATASVLRGWPRADLRHMRISLAGMFSFTTASAAVLGLATIESRFEEVLRYHAGGGYWPLRGNPLWLQIPLYFGIACMACFAVSVLLRFFSSFVLPKDSPDIGEKISATSEVQDERPSAKRRRWGRRVASLLVVSAAVLALTRCVYDFGYAHPLTEADTLAHYIGKNVTFRGRFGIRDEQVPPTVHFHGQAVLLESHPALGLNMFHMNIRPGMPYSRQPITVIGTLDRLPPGSQFSFTSNPDPLGREWRLAVNYCLRDAFWRDASEEGVSANTSR